MSGSLPPRVSTLLHAGLDDEGPIVVLTGAGVSAESGIPTFRGDDGYWSVGSRNYQPTELATREAFGRMPEEIWRWYLYRRSVCRRAAPNAAHTALVELERTLGDRFLLVTQNVDGLHRRAGNGAERTYEIHGNIDLMRCEDGGAPFPIPDAIGEAWDRETAFTEEARRLLSCCSGKSLGRPHVLWFDEYYDEALFRFESSLDAAAHAAMLIVVGTSGSTNLPTQMVTTVARRGAPMIVVNADESPFSELAERSANGAFLRGTACEHVPAIVALLCTP